MIKASYLVLPLILISIHTQHTTSMEPPINDTELQPPSQSQHQYIYLRPSQKINAGLFKSYEFDLRFPQIRGAPVSKNLFQGSIDYLSFKFTHQTQGKRTPNCQEDYQLIERELPMVPTDFTPPQNHQIKYTWIGHATAVFQIGPDSFLIDPIFAQKKKSKRFRPPACKISQLPKIDVVLVSHDHTDHFDAKSVQQLHDTFKPTFVLGLGSDDIMPKGSSFKTMDWMEEHRIQLKGGEYKITFVPVCHWARRGLTDLNTRLWGGFVVQSPFGHKIFYSGDTGYADVFKEIGHKFGPFDLSILPIGAYEPRELLKAQHINPDEAVMIHKEIKSRQSVGVHWGTFSMGRQGFIQPRLDLMTACKDHGLSEGQFLPGTHGQAFVFPKK